MYPNPGDSTHYMGKVDHQFAATDQFTVRYALYDVSSRTLVAPAD
jgi:hypothetical protein